MWGKLLSWSKFLCNAGEELESTSTQTKENTSQLNGVTETIRLLIMEQKFRDQLHAQEMAALTQKFSDELEKLELRLRLEIERGRQWSPRDEKKELS